MDPVTEPVDWDTPTHVDGKWVTVERQLNRDDEAVIATIEVTTDADGPVTVEVVDAFPEEWGASEVGVHPDYVPENFVADANRFEFTDTVEPDDPIEVVYGIKLDSTESIQPPAPPVIERERGLENLLDDREDPVEADGGGPDLESTGEPDDSGLEPGEPDDRDDEPVWNGAQPEAADRVPPLTRTPAAADAEADAGERAESLLRSSSDTGHAESPADRSDLLGEPSSLGDGAEETTDRPGSQSGSDASQAADTSDDAGGDDSFRFGRRDDEPDAGDADLVESLADELDARGASDEAVAAIREALDAGSSNRDAVRLNHLQSRVEEYAAYADMLGDLIDEHGTLEAVFDDQAARIGALEADLEEVRAELSEAGEDRDTLRNRLAATTERVEAIDDVADDVEVVREEVGQLRRDHGQELDDLGSAVDAIEADHDGVVDDLESKVDALEDRVETWDQTRQRLAEALVSASEPEPDDQR